MKKRRRGRQDKAKTGEEAECTFVHEHSEPVFNAVLPTQVVFQRPVRIRALIQTKAVPWPSPTVRAAAP
ncbi:MAG: hypothetical protein CVV09_14585 [Gammaproteobacteria bacterium HGW-Gammaproteobacteria-13]|nr:MAG: hypothetical protein CVV09_14585 [Gammaproteobacteria bacterium HGW-Gammaproteobacteria-13]